MIKQGENELGRLEATLDEGNELYQANWHTNEYDLSTDGIYRLSVQIDGYELGFADIDMVENGSGLRHVQTDEYIGLVDGRTLPVKFRVEEGWNDFRGIDLPIKRFATGSYHVCTLTTSVPTCVGRNDSGVWGTGQVAPDGEWAFAQQVAWPEEFASLTGNFFYMCGLTPAGSVYCWGTDHYGSLGIGASDGDVVPTPTLVSLAEPLTFVEANLGTVCGVGESGTGFCWGRNSRGQVGDGTQDYRNTPTVVVGEIEWAMISPGGGHTCGIDTSGALWCWGANAHGQLGIGSIAQVGEVVLSPTRVAPDLRWKNVSAAVSKTCAVTEDHIGYCWGRVPGDGSEGPEPSPVQVAGATEWRYLKATSGACGMALDGQGYCWSWPTVTDQGPVGDGVEYASGETAMTPQPLAGGRSWEAFGWFATAGHCGVDSSGDVLCWGITNRIRPCVLKSFEPISVLAPESECPPPPPAFYLAANGVTVMCPAASVGDTGVVNGITYTKRDRAGLDALVAEGKSSGDYSPLATSCVTGVTTMDGLFSEATAFNEDISGWDVSDVTSMRGMFFEAAIFNSPLNNWDVSGVRDMYLTFGGAFQFNQPLSAWDVGSVEEMLQMFNRAEVFNQPIGDWNVTSVSNMGGMFGGTNEFNQDLSTWCVSHLADPTFTLDLGTSQTLPQPVWGTCSPASLYQSTLTASSTSIPADGTSTVTLTVQLKDLDGVNLSENTRTLTFDTPSQGSISAVTVNNDGTFTATYTAGSTAGTVTITANLDGVAMTQTVTITLN